MIKCTCTPKVYRCQSCAREYSAKYYHSIKTNLRYRYSMFRSKAKGRQLEFNLTFDQFTQFLNNPCYYCAHPLPTTGYSLDRVDNAKGYTSENVVPCCIECNRIKGNMWTGEEMRQIGEVIHILKHARQKVA